MHLHKTIPLGAGLGGGSANAAAVLQLLNEKYQLKLSNDELIKIGLEIGSDVPFFIQNVPSFVSGRGEFLDPISLHLNDKKIVIINPGIHISTAWAFNNIVPQQISTSLKDIIQLPIKDWKGNVVNDFEKPVFEKYPEIYKIKTYLYNQGALYSAMSGSGSTVYGIFENEIPLDLDNNYFIKWI